jgi:hypothetical protein
MPSSPKTLSLADVSTQDVDWLWPGRIPIGKVTAGRRLRLFHYTEPPAISVRVVKNPSSAAPLGKLCRDHLKVKRRQQAQEWKLRTM